MSLINSVLIFVVQFDKLLRYKVVRDKNKLLIN